MEDRQQPLLQFRPQVDQQIAATQQVQFRERRFLDHVLRGKNQHLTNQLLRSVVAVILFDEETFDPFGSYVRHDARGIKADTSHVNSGLVKVSPKDLYMEVPAHLFHALAQNHGHRIGLLTA